MDWAELTIPAEEQVEDVLANILCEEGAKGAIFSTDETGRTVVSGFLPVNNILDTRVRRIRKRLHLLHEQGHIESEEFKLQRVRDEDWAENYKEHFHVERVTERIVICPSWREDEYNPRPGDIPLYIDPGMAFGTGIHPTTVMCLAYLERYLSGGELIYDVGTGSGILAIAAARLGAKRIEALDIDEKACEVAQENVRRNRVDSRVHVRHNDLLRGLKPKRKADIIVANIILEVVVQMLEEARDMLSSGGLLVVSGITRKKLAGFYAALRGTSWWVREEKCCGEWVAVVLKKGADRSV